MLRAYLGLVTFASDYTPGKKHLQTKRQETFKNIYPLPLIKCVALLFKLKLLTNISELYFFFGTFSHLYQISNRQKFKASKFRNIS